MSTFEVHTTSSGQRIDITNTNVVLRTQGRGSSVFNALLALMPLLMVVLVLALWLNSGVILIVTVIVGVPACLRRTYQIWAARPLPRFCRSLLLT